jgi:hypothetical protein
MIHHDLLVTPSSPTTPQVNKHKAEVLSANDPRYPDWLVKTPAKPNYKYDTSLSVHQALFLWQNNLSPDHVLQHSYFCKIPVLPLSPHLLNGVYEHTRHFSASNLLTTTSPEPLIPAPRRSPPRPGVPINYVEWEEDLTTPAEPINPADTTHSLWQKLDADECQQIALGLLATLRVQEAETSTYQSACDAELSNLGKIIHESCSNLDTLVSPPVPPTGFVHNEGQAPNFFIPVQDGFLQPAYWVKLLPNGQVAGLLKNNTPDTQPHIGELFCTDIFDPSNGPIQPMPAWLIELFTGVPEAQTESQLNRLSHLTLEVL